MPVLSIFVISLKSAIERRVHITNLMKKHDLQFTFFDAVDGQKLKQKELSYYNPEDSIRKYGRTLSQGEIGCYLSHLYLLKHIVNHNLPQALILEDDAQFGEDLLKLLNKRHVFPPKWEVITFYQESLSL